MMCVGMVSSGVMVMLPYFNRIISHYYPSTVYLVFPHPIFSIPGGPAWGQAIPFPHNILMYRNWGTFATLFMFTWVPAGCKGWKVCLLCHLPQQGQCWAEDSMGFSVLPDLCSRGPQQDVKGGRLSENRPSWDLLWKSWKIATFFLLKASLHTFLRLT